MPDVQHIEAAVGEHETAAFAFKSVAARGEVVGGKYLRVHGADHRSDRAVFLPIFSTSSGWDVSTRVRLSMARRVGGLMWCSMPSTSWKDHVVGQPEQLEEICQELVALGDVAREGFASRG